MYHYFSLIIIKSKIYFWYIFRWNNSKIWTQEFC